MAISRAGAENTQVELDHLRKEKKRREGEGKRREEKKEK